MLGQEAVGAGPGPPRWRRAVPLPLEAVGSVQRGQGWGLRRRGLCARRLGYVTQAFRSVARRQVPLWATVLPCAHRHGPSGSAPPPPQLGPSLQVLRPWHGKRCFLTFLMMPAVSAGWQGRRRRELCGSSRTREAASLRKGVLPAPGPGEAARSWAPGPGRRPGPPPPAGLPHLVPQG